MRKFLNMLFAVPFNKPKIGLFFISLAGLVFLLTACQASNQVAPHTKAKPQTVGKIERLDPAATSVVNLNTQQSVEQLVLSQSDQRLFFVAERHDRYDHHQLQLEVARLLLDAKRPFAIGVEWIQAPFQAVLDDFVAGKIDEAQMLRKTDYYGRWRFDYRLYRAIFLFAKEHQIPLIALNASQELTSAVSKNGLENLDEALKSQLPEDFEPADEKLKARMKAIFEQHAPAGRRFERFANVQRIWDETMAANSATYLTKNPDNTLVVFAGSGHIVPIGSIPERVESRIGLKGSVILPLESYDLAQVQRGFVALTQAQTLPPEPKLGLYLEAVDDGVKVQKVAETSAAGDAGIAKDDILLAIDGQPVKDITDIKLLLLEHHLGDTLRVTYHHKTWLGGEKTRTTEVKLR